MPKFRITEQEESVIERSYDIEADDFEQAEDHFQSLTADERQELCVLSEAVEKHIKIINVEDVTNASA